MIPDFRLLKVVYRLNLFGIYSILILTLPLVFLTLTPLSPSPPVLNPTPVDFSGGLVKEPELSSFL